MLSRPIRYEEATENTETSDTATNKDGKTVPGSNFEVFKERNKENVEALGWRGDEEVAAGLYAEHELLQAVFARGLQLQGDYDKEALVQKLYSQACEMLVGGTLPVEGEQEKFSQMLRRNPAEAVGQIFSRAQKFSFDVLVVNGNQELQQHIVCDINPAGQDRAYVMDKSSAATTQAMAIGGPIISPGQRESPSYTQHMAYQTSEDAGQFHVFSSQPPTTASQPPLASTNTNTNTNGTTAGVPDTMNMPDMAWLQEMNMILGDGLGLDDMDWMGAWEEETPDFIDLLQDRNNQAAEAASMQPPAIMQPAPAPRCRLQEDLQYLIGTLGQDETQLREQLARGERPAVFNDIYRRDHGMEMRGFPPGAVLGNGFLLDDVVRTDYDFGPVAMEEPLSPNTMQGMEFIQWPAN